MAQVIHEATALVADEGFQVSFQWKNPDFLFKNVDFIIKQMNFKRKLVDIHYSLIDTGWNFTELAELVDLNDVTANTQPDEP